MTSYTGYIASTGQNTYVMDPDYLVNPLGSSLQKVECYSIQLLIMNHAGMTTPEFATEHLLNCAICTDDLFRNELRKIYSS